MKRFSDEDWNRILSGEDFYVLKHTGRYRSLGHEDYTRFVDQLMEKVEEGYDISNVRNLQEIMTDIIYYYILDDKFMMKYEKFMNWGAVTRYQKLSEPFMEYMVKKLGKAWEWWMLCENQKLSEKFIRKHADIFDETCWAEISGNGDNNLSMDFMREFADFLQWNFIGECQTYDKNFLREFGDRISFGNYELNMRKPKLMTQEETLEFQPGFEDKVGNGVKVMDVCRGNYDKKRRFQDDAGTN